MASEVSIYFLKSGNQGFDGSKFVVNAITSGNSSSSSSLSTSRINFLRPPVLLFLTAGREVEAVWFTSR